MSKFSFSRKYTRVPDECVTDRTSMHTTYEENATYTFHLWHVCVRSFVSSRLHIIMLTSDKFSFVLRYDIVSHSLFLFTFCPQPIFSLSRSLSLKCLIFNTLMLFFYLYSNYGKTILLRVPVRIFVPPAFCVSLHFLIRSAIVAISLPSSRRHITHARAQAKNVICSETRVSFCMPYMYNRCRSRATVYVNKKNITEH